MTLELDSRERRLLEAALEAYADRLREQIASAHREFLPDLCERQARRARLLDRRRQGTA